MASVKKYLCFDIGYVKPGIVLIYFNTETKSVQIDVYENISFKQNVDSIPILDYFFSQKIDSVIVEQQHTIKNVSLLQFINGYTLGKGIPVIIKRPVSSIQGVKGSRTRSVKKRMSVHFLNNLLALNQINKIYLMRDSDICDAINIGLIYLFELTKKNFYSTPIKIERISHLLLKRG